MKPTRKKIAIILSSTLIVVIAAVILVFSGKREDEPDFLADPAESVGFLTSEEIPIILANGRPTMIEFGGRSCIPCKQMQPILAELKREYSKRIDIVNFYLEDDYAVANTFQIMLMPTQVIFSEDGEELARHVGLWQKSSIVDKYRDLGIVP